MTGRLAQMTDAPAIELRGVHKYFGHVEAVRGVDLTVPAGEGTMHTIVSDSAQRVQSPAWSPDGKKLAYISDASGEEQLYLADPVDGAQPKQLTTALKGEHGSLVWSPDSKFYSVGARGRHEPHGQFGALH